MLSGGRKTLLLWFTLLALTVNILPAQQANCAYCGGRIKGEYVRYEGKYYHKFCYEKVAPRCAYCKEIIEGEYVYFEDKIYHKQCYLNHIALRCAICRELIEGDYVENDGKKYHKHCYLEHIALHCTICGEPITSSYKTNFWGDEYHTEHDDEYSRCDYCQRLITEKTTGGGRKYSDGRHICNLCYEDAVLTDAKALSLFREVQSKLDARGIDVDLSKVPLFMVDKFELAEKSGDYNPKELGFTSYEETSMNGEMIARSNVIYTLTGLPEMIFKGVVAHEMMHVWMNLNTDHGHSPSLCEGAANYASYLIYSKESGKYAEFLIDVLNKDTDSIYGIGYRKVKNYIDQNGLYAFMKYLKYYKDLP